ncbi:MAG: tetraacyldisaccharide 4'-kinase [Hyphomicrobiales bacterium]|nr:tetraacyldisaccharide 4'-kinase [Hyphomicrobiales bacterium]
MPHKAPSWWARDDWRALALSPASALYGAAVEARFARATPFRAPLPVICIGNFTMGGAGKTPLAIAVAGLLRGAGEAPAFLTRGYGGVERGPLWVNAASHDAALVGDEPLLLAAHASTLIARDRPAGARAIAESGATVIVMDDGFQNPSLHKDFCLIAVDGGYGLGNGRVFPAGPLRARLAFQLPRADAVVAIGGEWSGPPSPAPLTRAALRPVRAEWLRGARVAAFCGIGRPEKFYSTLREAGAHIVEAVSFADHYSYREADAARLLRIARSTGAALVTTEKDYVKLSPNAAGALRELHAAARPLAIELWFAPDAEDTIKALLISALSRKRRS